MRDRDATRHRLKCKELWFYKIYLYYKIESLKVLLLLLLLMWFLV